MSATGTRAPALLAPENPRRGVLRIADLYARSERRPGSGCWWWLGAMASDKLSPRIWTVCHDRGEKRVLTGMRAVWNIKHGAGLGDRLAYMRCCNSSCVNPDHVGSAASKAEIGAHIAAHGKRKGTHVEARRASQKLAMAARGIVPTPPEVVRAIRASEGSNVVVARQFGVSHQIVSAIRLGLSHARILEAV